MPDRWERLAKLVCAALAVMLVFQLGRMVFRPNPLSHLTIPALPTLPPDTNAPAATAGNVSAPPPGMAKAGTNATRAGTNAVATATNPPPAKSASSPATNTAPAIAAKKGTNAAPVLVEDETHTNAQVSARRAGTNSTNVVVSSAGGKTNTNGKGSASAAKRGPNGGMPPDMAMMMGGGPGMSRAPELPLPVQARVFRITDSEILGPVMRPLPTALLGIVGEVAFVRSASGQSGVIKEGENVGALKLLKIGTNRVLVEEDGQKKELTIFSGYGGDSLMPKQKDNSQ